MFIINLLNCLWLIFQYRFTVIFNRMTDAPIIIRILNLRTTVLLLRTNKLKHLLHFRFVFLGDLLISFLLLFLLNDGF